MFTTNSEFPDSRVWIVWIKANCLPATTVLPLIALVCCISPRCSNATSTPDVVPTIPVVSNLGAAPSGFIQVANNLWWGLEFTTDNSRYLLNSVTLLMGDAFNNSATFSVNVYNTAGSVPGGPLPNG